MLGASLTIVTAGAKRAKGSVLKYGVIVVSCHVVGVVEKPDKPKDPPKPVAGKIICTARGVFIFILILSCGVELAWWAR